MQNSDLESRQKAAQAHLGKAMLAYVEDHTVAIVLSSEGHLKGNGTGICISIGDKILVFTAGHILFEASQKNLEIEIIGKGSPSPVVTDVISTNYLLDDVIDAGYIEISKESLDGLGKEAIKISQIRGDQAFLEDKLAVVAGFSAALRQSEPIPRSDYNRIKLRILSLQTVVLDPKEWNVTLQNLDKPPNRDAHIFLQYPESGVTDLTGEIIDVPAAFGISGGGIWALHQNKPGLWSPDYTKLIGIQYFWYPSLRLAKAIQIQHLLALVGSRFLTPSCHF